MTKAQALRGVYDYESAEKIGNNTYRIYYNDGRVAVRLHYTDVVTSHPDGTTEYNSGGWETLTTKERMNSHGRHSVEQINHIWYINGYKYYDGIKFRGSAVPEKLFRKRTTINYKVFDVVKHVMKGAYIQNDFKLLILEAVLYKKLKELGIKNTLRSILRQSLSEIGHPKLIAQGENHHVIARTIYEWLERKYYDNKNSNTKETINRQQENVPVSEESIEQMFSM